MIINAHDMALIKGHEFFSHIEDDGDVKWLLQCVDAKFEDVSAGTAITEAGKTGEFIPVVLSGEVDCSMPKPGLWELTESGRGITAPVSCNAKSDCRVLWLKVMRTVKPCARRCGFHEVFVEKISG